MRQVRREKGEGVQWDFRIVQVNAVADFDKLEITDFDKLAVEGLDWQVKERNGYERTSV